MDRLVCEKICGGKMLYLTRETRLGKRSKTELDRDVKKSGICKALLDKDFKFFGKNY